MIDLTQKSLPSTICVNGRDFLLKTDYRNWLQLDRNLQGNDSPTFQDIICVLDEKCVIPYNDELEDLFYAIRDFLVNKNTCPKDSGGGESVIDFEIDGEYIYAAFLQQYGIDLVDIEYLHWHKFLALFRSLSDNTMLGKIMSYRGYSKDDKSYEEQMRELKSMWQLPTHYTEEELEKIDEFEKYFS